MAEKKSTKRSKEELISLRKKIKSKKPAFSRQDSHKKTKLGSRWRKPKGLQSKMRKGLKGYKRKPSAGYGSPKAVKHLHNSGLVEVLVSTMKQLNGLDKSKHAVKVASVGLKKKLEIMSEALKKGLLITNMNKPDEFIKKSQEMLKNKKEEKKSKLEMKQKKKEERKKKAEDKEKEEKKEGIEKAISEEEKKESEKKEKDKLLTKKE